MLHVGFGKKDRQNLVIVVGISSSYCTAIEFRLGSDDFTIRARESHLVQEEYALTHSVEMTMDEAGEVINKVGAYNTAILEIEDKKLLFKLVHRVISHEVDECGAHCWVNCGTQKVDSSDEESYYQYCFSVVLPTEQAPQIYGCLIYDPMQNRMVNLKKMRDKLGQNPEDAMIEVQGVKYLTHDEYGLFVNVFRKHLELKEILNRYYQLFLAPLDVNNN